MLVSWFFFSWPCSVSVFWLAYSERIFLFFLFFFFRLRRQTNSKSPSNDSSASQENRPKSRPKPIKPASNYYSISAVQISGIYAYIMLYEDIMINRSRCVWVCVRQKVYFIMNIFV